MPCFVICYELFPVLFLRKVGASGIFTLSRPLGRDDVLRSPYRQVWQSTSTNIIELHSVTFARVWQQRGVTGDHGSQMSTSRSAAWLLNTASSRITDSHDICTAPMGGDSTPRDIVFHNITFFVRATCQIVSALLAKEPYQRR